MAKSVLLKDVVREIATGYPFKSRVESEPGEDVCVVQLRNIEDTGKLDVSEAPLVRFDSIKVRPRFWLQPGDILFRSRGPSMPAAVVPDDLAPAIAASPIIMIRVKPGQVDPAYLVWFLNHPKGQRLLQQKARGTSMPMVNKSVLGDLEIDLPPFEVQRQVVELADLQQQEKFLMEQLETKRQQFMDAVLMQCVKGELK